MSPALPAPPLPAVVLAVAPNGGRLGRDGHPAVPLTAAELAQTAGACLAAGAAMMHLHVRDRQGGHLLEATAYREALTAIRSAVGDDLVLQISTEALGRYAPVEQMALVRDVRPEAASLALRELLPPGGPEAPVAAFLAWMKTEGIAPQFILYEPAELDRLRELARRGFVPWTDPPVLLVLGRSRADLTAEPAELLPFLTAGGPGFSHWMVCAFGRHETACVTAAALRGGHVRVGFENNLHLPDGTVAPDNAAIVRVTAGVIRSAGRRIAAAAELRAAWAPR